MGSRSKIADVAQLGEQPTTKYLLSTTFPKRDADNRLSSNQRVAGSNPAVGFSAV